MKREQTRKIAGLIERTSRLLVSESHSEGLQPVQWEALRFLSNANQFSRTHAALTAYLGLTKGTVSQTVKALESKGLVRKEADLKDRRSNHLKLTPAGVKQLARDPLHDWEAQLQRLSKADRDALVTALSDLLNQRLEDQARAPFGLCRECVYFRRRHPEGAPHYCDLLNEPLACEGAALICAEQLPANDSVA